MFGPPCLRSAFDIQVTITGAPRPDTPTTTWLMPLAVVKVCRSDCELMEDHERAIGVGLDGGKTTDRNSVDPTFSFDRSALLVENLPQSLGSQLKCNFAIRERILEFGDAGISDVSSREVQLFQRQKSLEVNQTDIGNPRVAERQVTQFGQGSNVSKAISMRGRKPMSKRNRASNASPPASPFPAARRPGRCVRSRRQTKFMCCGGQDPPRFSERLKSSILLKCTYRLWEIWPVTRQGHPAPTRLDTTATL